MRNKLDNKAYFEDLSKEISALQNRVRNFIGKANWGEEGRWKESIIRTMLKRYLPDTLKVGSGFVVTPSEVSTQCDIIIYSADKPTLFKEDEFVVLTADAVKAVIEIKTCLKKTQIQPAIEKLTKVGDLLKGHTIPFLGIFAYEPSNTSNYDAVLEAFQKGNRNWTSHAISAATFGPDLFVKYWRMRPEDGRKKYHHWHAYNTQGMAAAYFIHNVITEVCPFYSSEQLSMWFPMEGKAMHKVGEKRRKTDALSD